MCDTYINILYMVYDFDYIGFLVSRVEYSKP